MELTVGWKQLEKFNEMEDKVGELSQEAAGNDKEGKKFKCFEIRRIEIELLIFRI